MKGIGWNAIQAWICNFIKLGVLVALGRILVPHDFGVFAISGGILGVLGLFANQGLTAAIVQLPEINKGHLVAAQQRVLAVSVGLMLMAVAGGIFIARTRAPIVGFALIILSFGLPFDSFGALALAILRRKLAFRMIALTAIFAEIVGAGSALLGACEGAGVWSLVARQVATQVTVFAVTFTSVTYRFRGTTRQHHQALARLGRMIALSNILVLVRERLDEPLVGVLAGIEALGFYSLARRLVSSFVVVLPALFGNLAWPLLSSQQADRRRFDASLYSITRTAAYIVWPVFAIFAVTAHDWVPLCIGGRWQPLLPIMDGLCAMAAMRAVVGIQITGLLASGRARERLYIECLTTLIIFAAMAAAAHLGAVGIAWSVGIVTWLMAPCEFFLVAYWLKLPPHFYIAMLWRPLGIASLLTALLIALSAWFRGRLSMPIDLGILLSAGLSFWALALQLLAPELTAAIFKKVSALPGSRRALPD